VSRSAPDAASLARRLSELDQALHACEVQRVLLNEQETTIRTLRGRVEETERILGHERDALLEHQRA
jgi:hypothetical protein